MVNGFVADRGESVRSGCLVEIRIRMGTEPRDCRVPLAKRRGCLQGACFGRLPEPPYKRNLHGRHAQGSGGIQETFCRKEREEGEIRLHDLIKFAQSKHLLKALFKIAIEAVIGFSAVNDVATIAKRHRLVVVKATAFFGNTKRLVDTRASPSV